MNIYTKLSYLEFLNQDIVRLANQKNQTPDKFIDALTFFEKFLDNEVKIPRTQLPIIPKVDIEKSQAYILSLYASNPILRDAIEGKQTVEQSALELGKVNKPVKRLLPMKLDKEHNARVDYLEELIGPKPGLRTRGLSIDNFLVAFSAASVLRSVSVYAAIQNGNYDATTLQDLFNSVFAAPIIIGSFAIWMKGSKIGRPQAKYIDSKVNQFYRG